MEEERAKTEGCSSRPSGKIGGVLSIMGPTKKLLVRGALLVHTSNYTTHAKRTILDRLPYPRLERRNSLRE